MGLQKTWFFRDFSALDGSDFYSAPRGNLDTPLYRKNPKSKKKIFWLRKGGGVPLRGPPPFPAFLRNGCAKILETFRVDRPRVVEQKLS